MIIQLCIFFLFQLIDMNMFGLEWIYFHEGYNRVHLTDHVNRSRNHDDAQLEYILVCVFWFI